MGHNKQVDSEKFLSTAEVLQIFNVSRNTLKKYQKTGNLPLPSKKLSGKDLYLESEVYDVLKLSQEDIAINTKSNAVPNNENDAADILSKEVFGCDMYAEISE